MALSLPVGKNYTKIPKINVFYIYRVKNELHEKQLVICKRQIDAEEIALIPELFSYLSRCGDV